MSLLEPDSVYADIAEKVIFNSFISGISLDGKSFFYSNMQENNLQTRRRAYGTRHKIFFPADTRVEVFDCSCCPPNVVRAISSIQDFAYSADSDSIFFHQYMSSVLNYDGKRIEVKTCYPFDNKINILYSGKCGKLALRIPGWCKSYSILKNGTSVSADVRLGYAYIDVNDADKIALSFDMPVRFFEAHPKVWDDAGKIAVTKGPIVFCAESIDNPYPINDIRLDKDGEYSLEYDASIGYPSLKTTGYIRNWQDTELYGDTASAFPVPVKLIPYFAFANRGECDMLIWMLKK